MLGAKLSRDPAIDVIVARSPRASRSRPLPLLVYNALAFGSPFHLGYASEEGFKELHTGFFGITYPRLSTIRRAAGRQLSRSAAAVAADGASCRSALVLLARAGRRGPALVAAGIGVYYLLLNASYFYWEGGWAFGPRQMTAALPFLALGLAPLWDRGRDRRPRRC